LLLSSIKNKKKLVSKTELKISKENGVENEERKWKMKKIGKKKIREESEIEREKFIIKK
jgi:hypothetical protein